MRVSYLQRNQRQAQECTAISRIYGLYDACKMNYSVKLWKTPGGNPTTHINALCGSRVFEFFCQIFWEPWLHGLFRLFIMLEIRTWDDWRQELQPGLQLHALCAEDEDFPFFLTMEAGNATIYFWWKLGKVPGEWLNSSFWLVRLVLSGCDWSGRPKTLHKMRLEAT